MTAPSLAPVARDSRPRPHVSIVMPTFNRAGLLRESAEMALRQTLPDLELIISDDHSTDNTPQVAAALAESDRRVRYHRPATKGGITGVVNEGIALARGVYVQICHDHDVFFPALIEKLAGLLDRQPAVVFAHPGRQGCDRLGNPLPHVYFVCGYPEVSDGRAWRRKMLAQLASPVTGMSMIRRSALEAVGLFDPDYGACSDIDMWLRLCAVGDVGYVNELLMLVREREAGHPYAGVNWNIGDEVIRAHRKHLRLAYQGWEYAYWKLRREVEIDLSLAFDYLNSIRRRQWDEVKRGRAYLRQHGSLVSRAAGWLL